MFLLLELLGCKGREGLANLPTLPHIETTGGYTWNMFQSHYFLAQEILLLCLMSCVM